MAHELRLVMAVPTFLTYLTSIMRAKHLIIILAVSRLEARALLYRPADIYPNWSDYIIIIVVPHIVYFWKSLGKQWIIVELLIIWVVILGQRYDPSCVAKPIGILHCSLIRFTNVALNDDVFFI